MKYEVKESKRFPTGYVAQIIIVPIVLFFSLTISTVYAIMQEYDGGANNPVNALRAINMGRLTENPHKNPMEICKNRHAIKTFFRPNLKGNDVPNTIWQSIQQAILEYKF